MASSKKKRLTKDDLELTLIALPTFIWYCVFSFIPMFGIIIAFKRFRISGDGFIRSLIESDFVGFKNFRFLFVTNDAFLIIRNTILYNLIFIILGVVIPVTLAVLIKQLLNPLLAKIYQTTMFLPHFLSWVVVSYFVYAFLSTDKGLINNVLVSLGGESVGWYQTASKWPYILVMMNVWKGVGYGMVVYLAAITGIDKSLYEAALIDGATKWQQIRYITIPSLKQIIVIMVILAVGNIFRADFGLFYQVPRNSGALYNATEVIDTYVYKALSGSGNIGMSSAAAFLQSVVGCITIVLANLGVRKIDRDSSLF